MKLKKVLYVPAKKMVWNSLEVVKNLITGNEPRHNCEIQYCGDIFKILGTENIYILGGMLPHYFQNTFPETCPYPSCHGVTAGTKIKKKQLGKTLNIVDAVLLSMMADWDLVKEVVALAKKKNVPVAMLDIKNYDNLYGDPNVKDRLTLGFKPNEDYVVYFKADLPLGFQNDNLLPLAPIPVRVESYQFRKLPKIHSVFYSGRHRGDKSQPERNQIARLVKDSFPDANIQVHEERSGFSTTRQYWDNISQAHIGLSPSGRLWDAFRHCEVALAPETAAMMPVPFTDTCDPKIEDGKNAILYEVELRQGRYYVKDPVKAIAKLKQYLKNQDDLKKIAMLWQKQVLVGHTVKARSQYILDTIDRNI